MADEENKDFSENYMMSENKASAENVNTPVAVPMQSTGSYSIKRNSGLGVAALILSILGFLTGFVYVGILFDLIAIGLSVFVFIKAKKQPLKTGLSIASIIIAAISITLCCIILLPSTISKLTHPEQENTLIESKGLFLLKRDNDMELDDLTAQQTYLIHIYDITPDNSKNVTMSTSGYIITNNTNEYRALRAPDYTPPYFSVSNSIDFFMLACGYAAPTEMGTILAGGEKIRAVSAYKINLNDINDDTTVTFKIDNCDVYNCTLTFNRDDIIPINILDDVFQIEDNPTDYKIAAGYFQRVRTICYNRIVGQMFDQIYNDISIYKYALNFTETLVNSDSTVAYSVTGVTDPATSGLPTVDLEAVKRVYPDLPVDFFEANLEVWIKNGKIAVESIEEGGWADTESGVADTSLDMIKSTGEQILEYYAAKLKNQ